MKRARYFWIISLLLPLVLLAACGDNSSGQSGPAITAGSSATPAPTVPGSKTAVAFFTPETSAPKPGGSYALAFDEKAAGPVLEASVHTPLPSGGPGDWAVTITADGVAKLTLRPADKQNSQVLEHYLNPDRLNNLLAQLDKLGVLGWPDTTPPDKVATGGQSRGLALALKGRAKHITDLTGNTNDNLSKMLELIRQTVEAAPPRNSP